ncbi:MAG: SCO family protein [Alphaproteobacteria bacterium]|nr:SCO family protein [Alphaproteobacteria bacterium]
MIMRLPRLVLFLSALLVGLILLATSLLLTNADRQSQSNVGIGGPFRLINQNGAEVSERDYLGRPALVFFGYTHCPDICPTKLLEVSEIFRALGADKKINALFISIDPERDTPALLKDYLSSFDPRIVGLTGTTEAIAAAEKTFRVYARKVETGEGSYSMDHTALVYLMDRQGRFITVFNTEQDPQAAAKGLTPYL